MYPTKPWALDRTALLTRGSRSPRKMPTTARSGHEPAGSLSRTTRTAMLRTGCARSGGSGRTLFSIVSAESYPAQVSTIPPMGRPFTNTCSADEPVSNPTAGCRTPARSTLVWQRAHTTVMSPVILYWVSGFQPLSSRSAAAQRGSSPTL